MPDLTIIAGPNGAGKTRFANVRIESRGAGFVYVNADEIARGLADAGVPQEHVDVRAGREMLRQIDALVATWAPFMSRRPWRR